MMGKISNLQEVIAKLKGFLPQYLAEHDIDTSKNFRCLNPKHEDKNPSMSLRANPENAFCFSCSCTLDIFQAAHWLEDKPVEGVGFIEQNVKYLADKYGVELSLEEMSEEELYRVRTYKAYSDASLLISNINFGSYKLLDKEIERRGWTKEHVAKMGIGTVNYKDFRESLKTMGYEASFLDEVDLGRPDIFSEDNMVFTIHDEWGRAVGFAARNLAYSDEKDADGKPKNGAKYKNQRTTGLRCNIYQKGKRLYNIHHAIKSTPPLYIFEGYPDVVTAMQAGLNNCAAIGGTAFTSQHLELLRSLNQRELIIALDSDKGGITKTADLLDKTFSECRDFKVWVVNLPTDMDPDDLIREKGVEEFIKLKRWSAFEWRLNRYPEDTNPEEICKTMISVIAGEESKISQDKMCGELCKFTGIDKKTIKSELERLLNAKDRRKLQEKESIIDKHFNEIKQNPDDAKALLYECAQEIEQVEEKYNENALSIDGFVEFVNQQRDKEEELDGSFAGFNLSESGFGSLAAVLNGNWREDVFMCLGGSANAGKSSALLQIAWEIASNRLSDPKHGIVPNNATVIYHTIDDSAEQLLPRLVVQAYGGLDLTINQVRNPNYYSKHEGKELVALNRKAGYEHLMQIISEGRLIMKDNNDGASFAFGENLIRYYKNKYPDRNIVYILDNLHKSPDYASMEPRMRFKTLSNHMKGVATKYHCCVMASVEYTKLPPGIIPNNNNIAETRALIYDTNFIGHMYNDLHEKGADAVCIHEYNGEKLPRVRIGVGKNKITEFKDRLFFDFFPAQGVFRAVPTIVAEDEMRKRKSELKSNGNSSRGYYSDNDNATENDSAVGG